MGFMQSYKHLDMLLKDMNGIGISGYINEMDNYPEGRYEVHDWTNDYKGLKHYRWIRNQIVHERDASEENMTDDEDTLWIDSFYNKVIRQQDPLALYFKSVKSNKKVDENNKNYNPKSENKDNKYSINLIILLILIIFLVVYIVLHIF